MAQAPLRNREYVNVSKAQSSSAISANDKPLLRLVVLSFGLLCMLQATLNVSLRIFLYNAPSQNETSKLDGVCNNLADQKLNFDKYFQDGWVYFNKSLYYISTVKRNWHESRNYCQLREADLIVINSRDEQEFTMRFHRFMWIGLSKTSLKRWTWVDKTSLTTSYWAFGEPKPGSTDGCVEVREFEVLNSWTNSKCEDQNYWICEKTMTM